MASNRPVLCSGRGRAFARLRAPTDKFSQQNLDIVLEMCDTEQVPFFPIYGHDILHRHHVTRWVDVAFAGFGGIKTSTECRNSLERHVSQQTLN